MARGRRRRGSLLRRAGDATLGFLTVHALRAIRLFTNKISEACIEGRQQVTESELGTMVSDGDDTVDLSDAERYLDPQFSAQLMSETTSETGDDELAGVPAKYKANLADD